MIIDTPWKAVLLFRDLFLFQSMLFFSVVELDPEPGFFDLPGAGARAIKIYSGSGSGFGSSSGSNNKYF